MDSLWNLINESAQYLLFLQVILLGAGLAFLGYATLTEGIGGSALAAICFGSFTVVSSLRAVAERHRRDTAQSTQG